MLSDDVCAFRKEDYSVLRQLSRIGQEQVSYCLPLLYGKRDKEKSWDNTELLNRRPDQIQPDCHFGMMKTLIKENSIQKFDTTIEQIKIGFAYSNKKEWNQSKARTKSHQFGGNKNWRWREARAERAWTEFSFWEGEKFSDLF